VLRINPDKALALPPVKYQIANINQPLPANWLHLLGEELIKHLNLQVDTAKANIHHQLNEKAGEQSTYTHKADLQKVLASLYLTLIDQKTLPSQRVSIAMKLVEGLPQCTPGFHNRCLMCTNTAVPTNLDELLSLVRQDLVARTASENTDEVHAHNRFFSVANTAGFGVRAMNKSDTYTGNIGDKVILAKLKATFATHYTPITILNSLIDQLRGLMSDRGYAGRVEAGYNEIYHQFGRDFLRPFIGELNPVVLWETAVEEDEITTKVLDIHWLVVKCALLQTIYSQALFIWSPEEDVTYQALLSDKTPKTLTTPLTHTTDELIQFMAFLREWPSSHKAAYVLAHLRPQPALQHGEILAALFRQHPSLLPILKTVTDLDINKHVDVYLATQLKQAATSGNLARLVPLVEQGISLLPVLTQLMRPENKAAFMDEPTLRQHLTANDFQHIFTEGKYQGKSLAQVWIQSQRGRYWLSKDASLRTRISEALDADNLNQLLTQAEQTKPILHGKLFAPVNVNLKTFLLLIAHGEQEPAEKMLKDASPTDRRALLTGKAIVRDYADETGRLLKGTALQLALGAEDVKYHDDEKAMTEMLMEYLRLETDGETLIADQIKAQFPKGWEAIEKARADRDNDAIKQVFDAVFAAKNDAEITQAVNVFKAYLVRENKGEDGNKVFKQGKYFNMDLLTKALDLYDECYDRNGGTWNSPKNLACWQKVIGSIQRYLSTPYMQATAQGIYYIVEGGRYVDGAAKGKEPLKRSLKFSYDNQPYFSGTYNGSFLSLGNDYAGCGRRLPALVTAWGGSQSARGYKNLCRAKTDTFWKIMRYLQSQPTQHQYSAGYEQSRCVIL